MRPTQSGPSGACRFGPHSSDLMVRRRFAQPASGRWFAPVVRGDCGFANGLTAWCQRAWATQQIVGKIQAFPSILLYPSLFLAGFDTRQIRQRLPALGQVLQGAPARAGAAEFPTIGNALPPFPCACATGNRTDQSATGRLLRRSSGSRPLRALRMGRGDRLSLP